MSAEARAALKAYFETNDRPTQAQFENLIDSLYNEINDGYVVKRIGKLTGFNMDDTTDQPVTLSSGTYAISNVILTNISGALNAAYEVQMWTGANRTGTMIFTSVNVADMIQNLLEADDFIDFKLMDSSTNQMTVSGTVYMSITTPNGDPGNPLTCDVYVIGQKID